MKTNAEGPKIPHVSETGCILLAQQGTICMYLVHSLHAWGYKQTVFFLLVTYSFSALNCFGGLKWSDPMDTEYASDAGNLISDKAGKVIDPKH